MEQLLLMSTEMREKVRKEQCSIYLQCTVLRPQLASLWSLPASQSFSFFRASMENAIYAFMKQQPSSHGPQAPSA